MSFSWTGRQLDSVTKDGVTTTYTYDSNGLRTSKTTGDDVTEYTYLGSSLVYQVTNKGQSDEESLYFYYDDTGLAAFYYESAQYPSDNGIYHYVKDIQGNIWGLIDSNGELIARDHYSAYGEYWSKWYVEEGPTSVLQRNNRVRNANPFHYRGYYYDEETGLYYCQSRYYDPEVDRWLNADGYVSTGQGVVGDNMFAYCGNNPANNYDFTGMFWKEIGDFFSNAWNSIKTFAKNTFGASSSTTVTVVDEKYIIPPPSPLTIVTGVKTVTTLAKKGDSSKPISVYANKSADKPFISSSAGLNINIDNFTLNTNLAVDDIGVSGAITKDNVKKSVELKLNLANFKVGLETATTTIEDDVAIVSYTNVSIDGWLFAYAYILSQVGTFQPGYGYAQ